MKVSSLCVPVQYWGSHFPCAPREVNPKAGQEEKLSHQVVGVMENRGLLIHVVG